MAILLTDPATLGHLVRRVRIASGMTQIEAAEFCGVSAPFLHGIEQGKSTARLGLVMQVCQQLGIRLEATSPVVLPESDGARRRSRRRS